MTERARMALDMLRAHTEGRIWLPPNAEHCLRDILFVERVPGREMPPQ
jgi:hypothetical protein